MSSYEHCYNCGADDGVDVDKRSCSECGTEGPTGWPMSIRQRPHRLIGVDGFPITAAESFAMGLWDSIARKSLRRIHRHHLPRRLRRKK